MVTIEHLQPIPKNSNPYHYDLFRQGLKITDLDDSPDDMIGHIHAMYGLRKNEIVLINSKTGERIEVTFNDDIREEEVKIVKGIGLRNQTSPIGEFYQKFKEEETKHDKIQNNSKEI